MGNSGDNGGSGGGEDGGKKRPIEEVDGTAEGDGRETDNKKQKVDEAGKETVSERNAPRSTRQDFLPTLVIKGRVRRDHALQWTVCV
jgi:hypothetical protein